MIPTLGMIDLGGPLTMIFGVLLTAALGCGAGYAVGASLGRTPASTPLSTTARLARERLASVERHLEKAAARLAAANEPELAGSARLLVRRLEDASGDLGSVERKASRAPSGASA